MKFIIMFEKFLGITAIIFLYGVGNVTQIFSQKIIQEKKSSNDNSGGQPKCGC